MKNDKAQSRVRTRKGKNSEPGWQEWVSTNGVLGKGEELAIPDSPGSISTESIRDATSRLAYSYWESRGGQGGSAEDDWYRAEIEIRSRVGARVTAILGEKTCETV